MSNNEAIIASKAKRGRKAANLRQYALIFIMIGLFVGLYLFDKRIFYAG